MQHVRRLALDQRHEHAAGGLVELEHDIADEAVARHDIEPLPAGFADGNVAALDVADIVDAGGLLEELMCLFDDRVALLVFLSDVEQTDGGIGSAQDIARIHRSEVGKADELAGIAIDAGAAVDDEHRLAGAGKQRPDRRPLHAGMEPEQQGARGHDGAGVARGDERIGLPLLLEGEPHDDRRLGFAADRGEGLVAHPHDVGRLDDVEPLAVHVGVAAQRRFDVRRAPDELDAKARWQLAQGLRHPLDFHLRRVIPAHRVERDADHLRRPRPR